MTSHTGATTEVRGYVPVNGLKMYYEIEGTGDPLVFIPPAFGFAGLKSKSLRVYLEVVFFHRQFSSRFPTPLMWVFELLCNL